MTPKFTNPHSRVHELELVSRAQLTSDVDGPVDADASDAEVTTSKRRLHELLLSEFGECLSAASEHTPKKKRRCREDKTAVAGAEDGIPLFRLLSSAGPRIISTAPKPPPPPITRPPDCEDNPVQADERMRRAYSVAVDSTWLEAQKQRCFETRVQEGRKLVHVQGTLPVPHPTVMITENYRHQKKCRQTLGPPASASESPHSLRAKCIVLPIHHREGSQLSRRAYIKGGRKRSYERPPPAYWRPNSDQREKCLGYALGYPGSWSVRYEGDPRKRWYVRDVMRKGTFIT